MERLTALLDAAGPRFKLAQPAHWPAQARLAHEARWQALRALQQQLSSAPAESRPVVLAALAAGSAATSAGDVAGGEAPTP